MSKACQAVALGCLVVLLGTLGACGGGGSSDSGSGGECADPTYTTLTGIWTVQNEITGDCQNEVERFEVYIEQDGSELQFLGRTSFTATMCGTRASADRSISYVRNEGVMTVNNLVLTFTSETTFTGTAQWTWAAGSAECSGSLAITGIR